MSTLRANKKFHRIIREFYDGKLKSNGKRVRDEKQAIAIAFSEARKIQPRYKIKKYNNGTKIKIDNTTQLIFDDAWQKYLDYLASPQTQNLLFEQWLQRDPIGLSYNKRLANIMRSEPHAMNEPRMNQRGSKIIGNSHENGGVKGVIRETQQPIEVEGDELIITKGVARSNKTVICAGHPEGVASRLNEMHGGNKISNQQGECKEINMNKYILSFKDKPEIIISANSPEHADEIYRTLTQDEALKIGIDSTLYEGADPISIIKLKHGKKIKSHINSSKNERIERMIIRDNKLKNESNTKKMANGDKVELYDNIYLKINEPREFEILETIETNGEFRMQKVLKTSDILIMKKSDELESFLDKYGIHYIEWESKTERDEWLMNLLPKRIKNKIQ